jgi:hypothetical protein
MKVKIIDRFSSGGDIQYVDSEHPDLKLDYIKRRFEIIELEDKDLEKTK